MKRKIGLNGSDDLLPGLLTEKVITPTTYGGTTPLGLGSKQKSGIVYLGLRELMQTNSPKPYRTVRGPGQGHFQFLIYIIHIYTHIYIYICYKPFKIVMK